MSDEYWFQQRYDAEVLRRVQGMKIPVKCTSCGHIYDLQGVTVTGRYTDCSVWKCPGCSITVDDRPLGWGAHHYIELDGNGFEKR